MANKKHQGHDEHVDESWLIPYADMLTLLLALFVILFAVSQVDAQKYDQLRNVLADTMGGTGVLEYHAPIQEMDTVNDELKKEDKDSDGSAQLWYDLEVLKEELDRYIDDENLSERLSTEITREGLLVTINDQILFDSGDANMKKEARKMVVKLADILASDPPKRIQISGHTDNRPIYNSQFRSNWELSSVRALNVMNIFLENEDVIPKQLSIAGYGEYQPIASNDTAEGRERNRRVEVLILPRIETITSVEE
ncbi:flagellar motor protein MotB [Bacillus alkalicellulosilyticus]|uniref:flagellar motor protein MotB n=1 Tax=Alkalihalobacterium alkalicellulosilyticum TaxID=1912214 RepID=UPI000995E36F|nr:flagellar motor protein MotB [Bacillus alkalicellulosilyticus]